MIGFKKIAQASILMWFISVVPAGPRKDEIVGALMFTSLLVLRDNPRVINVLGGEVPVKGRNVDALIDVTYDNDTTRTYMIEFTQAKNITSTNLINKWPDEDEIIVIGKDVVDYVEDLYARLEMQFVNKVANVTILRQHLVIPRRWLDDLG